MSIEERTSEGSAPPRGRARLLADVASIAGSILLVGVSYGALAEGAGLPAWFVVALALCVLAASSELILVGGLAAGASPLVAALGALLVNLRNGLYGMSAARYLPRGRVRFLDAHLVNDESTAYALPVQEPAHARRAFRAVGVGILVCWPTGAALGVLLGRVVPDTDALGLDAVFPAILLAMVIQSVRQPRTAGLALGGSVVAAAATPWVALGVAPMLGLLVLAPGAVGIVRRSRGRGRHDPVDPPTGPTGERRP